MNEVEKIKKCIADMEKLKAEVRSIATAAAARAREFTSISIGGTWSGAAAEEFQDELDRTRDAVSNLADGTSSETAVITAEITLKQAELLIAKAKLEAARFAEALERAKRNNE